MSVSVPVSSWINGGCTHQPSVLSAQLLLQTIGECPRYTGLVGVELVDNSHEHTNTGDKGAEQHSTESGLEVIVTVGGEDTENIVVLVNGFAVVAAFLRVPPVSVGVTVLTLDRGWVDVASVLNENRMISIGTLLT